MVEKFQVKGELEWKVGKWAGVPVRPGIAHWERRERVEDRASAHLPAQVR